MHSIDVGNEGVLGKAVFLTGRKSGKEEADTVVQLKETLKGTFGGAYSLVSEVATLLTALGKSPLALALRIMWSLFSVRLSFATLFQFMESIDWGNVSKEEAARDKIVKMWFELACEMTNLKELRDSSAAPDCCIQVEAAIWR